MYSALSSILLQLVSLNCMLFGARLLLYFYSVQDPKLDLFLGTTIVIMINNVCINQMSKTLMQPESLGRGQRMENSVLGNSSRYQNRYHTGETFSPACSFLLISAAISTCSSAHDSNQASAQIPRGTILHQCEPNCF